jgi:hypothetical protein
MCSLSEAVSLWWEMGTEMPLPIKFPLDEELNLNFETQRNFLCGGWDWSLEQSWRKETWRG